MAKIKNKTTTARGTKKRQTPKVILKPTVVTRSAAYDRYLARAPEANREEGPPLQEYARTTTTPTTNPSLTPQQTEATLLGSNYLDALRPIEQQRNSTFAPIPTPEEITWKQTATALEESRKAILLDTQGLYEAFDPIEENFTEKGKPEKNPKKRKQTFPTKSHEYTQQQHYEIIKHPSFLSFADDAYAAEHGVLIRKSPVDGEYEMFVAGTRTGKDWAANFIETPYYSNGKTITGRVKNKIRDALPTPFRYRKRYVDKLSEMAKKYNVKRVYGHSRAAGIISEMENENNQYTKIGLDGAMILARDKNMLNFTSAGDWSNPTSSVFDGILAIGGKNNVSVEATKVHSVY